MTPPDPQPSSDVGSPREVDPVNIADKLALFDDHWAPRRVAQYNANDVSVVKVLGEFVWHSHPDTDDFFLVVSGTLTIEMEDHTVELGPGELYVVPRGIAHRPVAHEEVHLVLIEPSGTPNTGDADTAAPTREL